MSTISAPPPARSDVQEFQFKLLARLRVFKESPPLKQSLNLVASVSKFGLIFVGTPNGFDVISTSAVIEAYAAAKKPAAEVTQFPRRSVTLGAQPSHLDVSCDGQHLAVGYNSVIRIYDIPSITSQAERVVSEVRLLSPLQALSWNPGLPSLLAACMQDGTAAVYEFKGNSFDISSIPPEAQATCLCWSPKGKQIVIGSRDGSLKQFKPDLKIVKAIPPPQGGLSMVSIQWLSNLQYAAVYSTASGPWLMIINTPRNQPVTYVNYEDITYSNGDNRITQFYFIHQQAWNVLMVGSANSMEVGVLAASASGTGDWEQWAQEGEARAELPLSASRQDTHPVGMAFDTSPQYNLPCGENQQLPPMPLLVLLSHEGLLTLYWAVNLTPGVPVVCNPATTLPDVSGLQMPTPQTTQTAVSIQPEPQQQSLVSPLPLPAVVSSAAVSAQAVSAQPLSFTSPPQWQQPPSLTSSPIPAPAPAISQPNWSFSLTPNKVTTPTSQPETSVAPSSWMNPPTAAPTAFVPAFAGGAPSSAFSALPTAGMAPVPTSSLPVANAPAPSFFSLNSAQTPVVDLSSKSGAFVPASVPTNPNPLLTSTPTKSPAPVLPSKEEISTVPSFVRSPSPEPETLEESQELKAMNEALIQEAMREEILHFDKEMHQLGQRVRGININVLNHESLDNLTKDRNEFNTFMDDLKETTLTQENEVKGQRKFIVDAFAYIERMKTRMHLENNPDYLGLQADMGPDPLQARKINNIKKNMQFIESRLANVSKELNDQWLTFQKSNKESRDAIYLPSIEAIYEAMVMHNSVAQRLKNHLDELEVKVKNSSRKKLISLINLSRMLDNSQSEKDSEFYKIAQQVLSINLNLDRTKRDNSVEDIQESINSLSVNQFGEFSLTNQLIHKNTQKEPQGDRMELLSQLFSDNRMKNVDLNKKWTSPSGLSLPMFSTPNSSIGSISSGQPVLQSSSPKPVKNNENKQFSQLNKGSSPTETNNIYVESKPKTLFTTPTSTKALINPILSSAQTPIPRFTTASFASNLPPNSLTSTQLQNVASSTQSTTAAVAPFSFISPGFTAFSPPAQTATTAAPVSSTSKGFSFAPLTTQSSAPFSLTSSFAFGTQMPASTSPQHITASPAKPGAFSTVATSATSAPSIFSSGFMPEATTATSSPLNSFKLATPEKTESITSSSFLASSSPLASLNSLVSGIEPLKSTDGGNISPKNTMTKSPTQPFAFKVPTTSENKTSLFALAGSKPEQASTAPESHQVGTIGITNQFGGAFKTLSFDSAQQKPVFGGASTSFQVAENTQAEPISKLQFSFPSTNTANIFATPKSSINQKSIFTDTSPLVVPKGKENLKDGEKAGDSILEEVSPVIEVSLTPTKSDEADPNTTLEQLAAKKDIVITRIESSVAKSPPSQAPPETDFTSAPVFGSLTLGTLTTTTKSQPSIFGGSSPSKPPVMYEIAQPEPKVESVEGQETTTEQEKKATETVMPQNLFGGGTKTSSAAAFSFSTSSVQTSTNQSQPISGFSLGLKLPASTAASATTTTTSTTEVISSFSFAPTTTQSSSTSPAFSFSIPSTVTTTPSTTFGFGNLSTGSSEDKSKTGFSFGQPTQAPASTSSNIFGGFASKPAGTTSIFVGQTEVTTSTGENKDTISKTTASTMAETKSIFGQTPTTTIETKSVFELPTPTINKTTASTMAETKNVFGQTPTTTIETKSVFELPTPTINKTTASTMAETTSIFGQTPTTTIETKSIFGQTPTTTIETKSIFGQTSTTTTETKSVFGQPASTTETKSMFGLPATTTENKSIFGQPATTTENNSIFGQPASTTENNRIFGQTATTVVATTPFQQTPSNTETKNLFGQPLTSGETKSIFGQVTPNTGTSIFGQTQASTEPKSIFGQTQISGTEASSNIFGQPSATTTAVSTNFSFSLNTTTTAQTSFFGTPTTTTTASFFGQPICSPTSTASSPFGQSTANPVSVFGNANPTPFGGASAFGSKPTFGQSGGSFFGQSSGFGVSGSSLFGGGTPSVFGNTNSQPASGFGQPQGGSGNIFGGGSFSGGNGGVGQAGFGTPVFQNKPAAAFGSASPPAFGAAPAFGVAPTFGGSAAFGSPPKMFGGGTTASPTSGFGGPTQQSSTFENLANQNTMTFGNLAQNQSPAFGSMFPAPQANIPTPAFPPATSNTTFGGSSFSSWR